MYSNERRNGFSLLDILVKIVFAGLFIFILVWLFQKKVPNMIPFYSNVFRENIKYMQEAGESYFTDDKMPSEVGKEEKISLSDMIDKKLILPFVDEDGNSCNLYESYVSVTKNDDSYSLKTNLVCNNEKDYTIKILGCHNYCEGDCEKTCKVDKITKYQYKKLVSSTYNKYSCASGFTLNNKYCYKKTLVDSKPAEVRTVSSKTYEEAAKVVFTDAEREQLPTTVTSSKVYVDVIKTTTPSTTVTRTEAYSCTKYKTEKKCTTHYEQRSYSCRCTTGIDATGKPYTKCDTCYETVPVETCNNVQVPYTDTCYRTVTDVIPGKTTYSCPTDVDGSEGSGSTLKCYKIKKTYSCPTGTTVTTGSGSTLKCYKVTPGSYYYECEDLTYTLKGSRCYKTVYEEVISYKCDDGYKLEKKVCNKYSTLKEKAKVTKKTSKYYKYTWNTKTTLSGWIKTGKTKTVDGEKTCE